jgi:hypothetical protein
VNYESLRLEVVNEQTFYTRGETSTTNSEKLGDFCQTPIDRSLIGTKSSSTGEIVLFSVFEADWGKSRPPEINIDRRQLEMIYQTTAELKRVRRRTGRA